MKYYSSEMNFLKLATKNFNLNNTGRIYCNNSLKQQSLLYFKRAANCCASRFIRNTGGLNLSTAIHRSKDYSQLEGLPFLQLQAKARGPIIFCQFGTKTAQDRANKSDTKAAAVADVDLFGETSNLGLFAKFKLMYKKYWYVLIPVHVVTSAGWMCGFYYLSKSGVDVPSLLQYLHLSETILEKVKSSNLGHWAIAYLCYKVATPVRYAVTLGGTTVSIKYLVQQGHIKPMPTKEEFVRMYEDQKAHRAAVKANAEKEQEQNQKNK